MNFSRKRQFKLLRCVAKKLFTPPVCKKKFSNQLDGCPISVFGVAESEFDIENSKFQITHPTWQIKFQNG